MSESLSLRHNFSWTLVGNVVYSACQWGMLIVLAKLGTPEMVGEFTFAFAVTAPLFMLTNLQLRVVQATDSRNQFTFSDYLGLRLASSLLALAVLGGLVFVLPYGPVAGGLMFILGIAKAIESISDVCYGFMQQQERMDFISISLISKGILSLLCLTVFTAVSQTVVGGMVGLLLAWSIILFGYDLRVMGRLLQHPTVLGNQRLIPRWHGTTQRQLIGLTLPLGFVMLLVSLNTNIPRYFIEHFLSPRELGIFAAIAYLMLVGSIIQGALAQAASPRLAKYYAEGQRTTFIRLLMGLMGLGLLMGGIGIGVAWGFGKSLLTLLYKPEYAQYSGLLIWLMIAAALEYLSSFLGTAITSARYFRSQVPLFLTTAATLAIACYVLISSHGLNGIAAAMILTGLLRIVLCLVILVYALRQPTPPRIAPPLLNDA